MVKTLANIGDHRLYLISCRMGKCEQQTRLTGVLSNVKEACWKTHERLTAPGSCKWVGMNQAAAGMKPKRVRALIQREALRCTESCS